MINLGDGPFRGHRERDIILSELRLAGVTNITIEEDEKEVLDPRSQAAGLQSCGIMIPSMPRPTITVMQFNVTAKMRGWSLDRAWYYWVVSCSEAEHEIGPNDAMILHKAHGKDLRVNGDCGSPAPAERQFKYRPRVSMKRVPGGVDLAVDEKFHTHVSQEFNNEDSMLATLEELDKEFPGRRGGIAAYHIDTPEALGAFCGYLSARGLINDRDGNIAHQAAMDRKEWGFRPIPRNDGWLGTDGQFLLT